MYNFYFVEPPYDVRLIIFISSLKGSLNQGSAAQIINIIEILEGFKLENFKLKFKVMIRLHTASFKRFQEHFQNTGAC